MGTRPVVWPAATVPAIVAIAARPALIAVVAARSWRRAVPALMALISAATVASGLTRLRGGRGRRRLGGRAFGLPGVPGRGGCWCRPISLRPGCGAGAAIPVASTVARWCAFARTILVAATGFRSAPVAALASAGPPDLDHLGFGGHRG